MKQKRGCSRLFMASYTYDATNDTVTYGTPKQIAPVISIQRTIDEANEEVWGDNVLQDVVYGGKSVTRDFEVIAVPLDIEAELFGYDAITIAGTEKGYATTPSGANPNFAIGYALHDGDIENPCELVWAMRGRAVSLTKASSTIKKGDTSSQSQTLQFEFMAPDKAFTATSKRNLDFTSPFTSDTSFTVEDWFTQVVTPDNASTVLVDTPTPVEP